VLTQRTDTVFDFWSTIGQIGQLRDENDRLRKEVAGLRQQNAEFGRAETENVTMRAQLKYAQANPQFTLLPASVVGKDLHGLDDYVEIDRGTLDGVLPQMTVVSPDGYLVGRILNAAERRARVLIVTNPSSSVAAVIANADGQAEDVADGRVHGKLRMRNIPQNAKVKVGEDVLTSGLGGNFPRASRSVSWPL